MHKLLKSFLVASLAVSSLTACATAPSPAAKDPNPSVATKEAKTMTPSKSAAAESTPVTNTSPAAASANGTHAIAVGLGADANNQVQSQPAPGTCHVGKASNGQPLPDPNCTPGTTNPAVNQENLSSTICKSGYTKGIRPTASITEREKKANAASYAYAGSLGDAEYDHLISLELGGSPNDPKNLWVEPGGPDWKPADKFRNDKDAVENKLNAMVCSHKVTLADAQSAIANDWTTALTKLGG
jgi:hypothetical protein